MGSCSQLAAWRIRAQLEAMSALAPELHADGGETVVHRSRVAARRVRSAIRFFGPWLPESALEVSAEWKRIATRLGPVRDADVTVALVKSIDEPDPDLRHLLLERLSLRRRRAQHNLRSFVRSERLNHLVKVTGELIHEGEGCDLGKEGDALARLKMVRKRADRHFEMALSTGDHAHWHLFRIEIKRVRYALEALALLDPKGAKRALKTCEALQEELGAFQDATILDHELLAFGVNHLVQLDEHFASLQHNVPAEWMRARKQIRRFG